MTVKINTQIADGGGILPKKIYRNSVICLDASMNIGQSFSWETVSVPKNSMARFSSPMLSITKFGPLNVYGVYLIKLWINVNQQDQKNRTLALSVPKNISNNIPADPDFKSASIVRNRDFSTEGSLPGRAAWWAVEDDADLLIQYAGESRGRCIPENYASNGRYVMVLGDDRGRDGNMSVGNVFSISQYINFTNINVLTINLKYIKRR